MEFTISDELAQMRKPIGQRIQYLAQRTRLEFEVCDTGALTRDTEEFDMHAGRKLMIALAVTPTSQ